MRIGVAGVREINHSGSGLEGRTIGGRCAHNQDRLKQVSRQGAREGRIEAVNRSG